MIIKTKKIVAVIVILVMVIVNLPMFITDALASTLTGLGVTSNIGGPPFMANRLVSASGGQLTAEPISDDSENVTYEWFMTEGSNIVEGGNNTYVVDNMDIGNATGRTDKKYIVDVDSDNTIFGKYVYCVGTLGAVSGASTAYKIISQPALIGDLVIDYNTNTIVAPLEDDGNATMASANKYGTNMAASGKVRILDNDFNVIEEVTPTYGGDGKFLVSTFNQSLKDLEGFQIDFGHDNYLGALRAATGKVPTDVIIPGVPSLVINLLEGGGNGQISLTPSYVQSVITQAKASFSGLKIVIATDMSNSTDTVNLDADIVSEIAEGDMLFATTGNAKLAMNKDLLTELKTTGGDVSIDAKQGTLPTATMEEEIINKIADRPVVNLSINAGTTAIENFSGDGNVKVSIPYTLQQGEDPSEISVYYIKDDGSAAKIDEVTYDNGMVIFDTNHFSLFATAYEGEWNPLSFVDDYNNKNFTIGYETEITENHTNCLPTNLEVNIEGIGNVSGYKWFVANNDAVVLKKIPTDKLSAPNMWGPKLDKGTPKNSEEITGATTKTFNTSILTDHARFKNNKSEIYVFCEVTLDSGKKRYTPVRLVCPDTWGMGGDVDYIYQPTPSLYGGKYKGFNSDTKVPAFLGEEIEAELADIVGVKQDNIAYQWYQVLEKDVESFVEPGEDDTNNKFPKSNAVITPINGETQSSYIPKLTDGGKYIFCKITADGKTFDTPIRVGSLMVAPNIKKENEKFVVNVDRDKKSIAITLEDVPNNGPFKFDADECGNWAKDNGRISVSYVEGDTSYTILEGNDIVYNETTNVLTSTFDIWPDKNASFYFWIFAPPYLVSPDSTVTVNYLGDQIDPIPSGRIKNKVVLLTQAPTDSSIKSAASILKEAEIGTEELCIVLKGNNATISSVGINMLLGVVAPNAPNAKPTLAVETDAAGLKFDQGAINAVKNSSGNVVITADEVKLPSTVVNNVNLEVGNRPVVDLNILSDGNAVTDFNKGTVNVKIPYTLGAGEDPENILVYYVKDNGEVETVTNAKYSNGVVSFTTNHFSKFAVAYKKVISSSDGGFSFGGYVPTSKGEVNESINVQENINIDVDKTGNGKVNISKKTIQDYLKNVSKNDDVFATLNIDSKKNFNSLSLGIEESAVSELIKSNVKQLNINSDIANISLDKVVLNDIKNAKGDINFNIEVGTDIKLSSSAKKLVGNRPVISLSIKSGNNVLSEFNGGNITISTGYTLGSKEKADNVQFAHIDEKGNVNYILNSTYDSNSKKAYFSTKHLSTFAVVYNSTTKSYADISKHWAKEDIDFVTKRGILTKGKKTKFMPNANVKPSEFIEALSKISDIDVDKIIAKKVNNKEYILREEMAVIMEEYAKATGYNLNKLREEVEFSDMASESEDTIDCVKLMQSAGVIVGKNKNKFDPKGKVTNGEAAAILRRYIELVLNENSAQGFDKNDAGTLMFFDDGKMLKSVKKDIGDNEGTEKVPLFKKY